MEFRVWAPQAKQLDVEVAGALRSMQIGPGGWWRAETDHPPGEVDYGFRIDGGPVLPDPRSPWQPYGVHGRSRSVDHSSFAWTDEGFQARPLSSALIYELHVGTFTPEGTFDAVIGKLDHLRSLGVTHVEIMPVADFPGAFGWGYDGVDLWAPRHQYGGPQGLKRLVDTCHAKGLGVLLDVVYNHLGPRGNYLGQFGPYFTDRHNTPWGWALNFDSAWSDEVRCFFCDNALMWLRDYHFDGLRLDAVHAIVDTSAIPFLEQLATEVDELKAHLGRHLVLIAESDLNDPRVVRRWEMGGFGLDAQWSDDFHHALHSVITGERNGYYEDFGSMADLATVFKHPYVYSGQHSTFRQRQHGRPYTGSSGHHFLSYVQNHDQLGNRAKGDRLCHLSSTERAKVASALVMVSPFVPLLFQGEEWGATAPFQYFADYNEEDPKLASDVREGRRREFAQFGWNPDEVPDPGARETFLRSKLDWDEVGHGRHAELLDWHRRLVELRRSLPTLTDGRLDLVETNFSEQDKWLIIQRGPVTIGCNLSDCPQTLPLDDGRPDTVLLSSKPAQVEAGGLRLAPDSVAILGPPAPGRLVLRKSRKQDLKPHIGRSRGERPARVETS